MFLLSFFAFVRLDELAFDYGGDKRQLFVSVAIVGWSWGWRIACCYSSLRIGDCPRQVRTFFFIRKCSSYLVDHLTFHASITCISQSARHTWLIACPILQCGHLVRFPRCRLCRLFCSAQDPPGRCDCVLGGVQLLSRIARIFHETEQSRGRHITGRWSPCSVREPFLNDSK